MADSAPSKAPPAARSRLDFLGPLLGILVVLVLATIVAAPRVPAVWSYHQMPDGIRNADGRPVVSEFSSARSQIYLPDPDDYTRLYRATKIANGDVVTWKTMEEINAPVGIELHWTAPMDYLVADAGRFIKRFAGGASAFESSAAILPFALGLFHLLCLMGLVRQLSNWPVAIACGALAAVSPSFQRVFELGHIDHHCLLEVLLIQSAAWIANGAFRAQKSQRPTAGTLSLVVSGILMGLAVWTAAQAMLFSVIVVIVLFARAVSSQAERRTSALIHLASWSTASALVIALACFDDGPSGFSSSMIDRVSGLHLCITGAIASIAWLMFFGKSNSQSNPGMGRMATTILALVTIGTLGFAITQVPEAIRELNSARLSRWHSLVAELQPLVAISWTDGSNYTAGHFSLDPLHLRLGHSPYLILIALPCFALAARIPVTVRWLLGIVAAMIAALSILQLRWIDHYATFVLPVIAVGLYEAIGRAAKASARFNLSPRVQAAIVFILLGASSTPHMTWPRLALLARANAAATADPKLAKPETQALLRALGPRQDQIRTDFVARAINLQECKSLHPPARHNILCEEGEGPTLLYETGLPVVAAPYHRAIGGIVAMMEFFAERDPGHARAMLDRLQVRYIVVPDQVNEQLMNFEQIAFGELRSYDPPDETLDAHGRLQRKLHYKPEVAETMAYRLAIRPRDHGIPGVELLYGICDDPSRPDEMHGLLFVVNEMD